VPEKSCVSPRTADLFLHQTLHQSLLRGQQRVATLDATKKVQQPCNRAGPAGLVARPDACPVVAVEVLVEQDQVAPVRILLELRGAAVHRAAAFRVAQEDPGQARGNLPGHVEQRQIMA
jgi:hypothetical protein